LDTAAFRSRRRMTRARKPVTPSIAASPPLLGAPGTLHAQSLLLVSMAVVLVVVDEAPAESTLVPTDVVVVLVVLDEAPPKPTPVPIGVVPVAPPTMELAPPTPTGVVPVVLDGAPPVPTLVPTGVVPVAPPTMELAPPTPTGVVSVVLDGAPPVPTLVPTGVVPVVLPTMELAPPTPTGVVSVVLDGVPPVPTLVPTGVVPVVLPTMELVPPTPRAVLVTVSSAESTVLSKVAVRVTALADCTEEVPTVKVAVVAPFGMVTLAGTVATAALLVVKVTTTPLFGAAAFMVSVPVQEPTLPTTELLSRVKLVKRIEAAVVTLTLGEYSEFPYAFVARTRYQ